MLGKTDSKHKGNFKNSNNKKFKNDNQSKIAENSQTDSENDDFDDGSVVYNMPKPGPHAKAGEWRKWKMMKRTIRQQREEKKIIKRREIEEKEKELAEYRKLNPQVKQGRSFTISIAIPGSLMGKVQSKELKTYVAGQIGRAATLFSIDEIIVYNDYALENKQQNENNEQLIKILEYMECPQYLRKTLFPPHRYLEHVGLLHPLEAPHHFKINDDWEYREGVVTDIPTKEDKGSWVDIGLLNKIQIDKKLQAGLRVTVKKEMTGSGKLKGIVVSPETPRVESGLYWGYQVRYASAFRKIIYESSFNGNYDLKIGINLSGNKLSIDHINQLPSAKRALIVFGGLNGIEAALEADEKLKANKIEQVFNLVCESPNLEHNYGSRSIRLEEAILVTLAVLRPKIIKVNESCKEKDEIVKQNEDEDEDEDEDDEENEKSQEEADQEESENEDGDNDEEKSEDNDSENEDESNSES